MSAGDEGSYGWQGVPPLEPSPRESAVWGDVEPEGHRVRTPVWEVGGQEQRSTPYVGALNPEHGLHRDGDYRPPAGVSVDRL